MTWKMFGIMTNTMDKADRNVSPIVVPNGKLYRRNPHRQIQSQTHIKVRTTTPGEQNGMSHTTTSTGLVLPELRVRPRLLTTAEAAGRPIWLKEAGGYPTRMIFD